MSTEIDPTPLIQSPNVAGAELDHVTCCRDSNLALCGCDITHHTYKEVLDDLCVVCDDLDDWDGSTCPLGGRCREFGGGP